MATTYNLISSHTADGSSSQVDFNSIPQIYEDLVIISSTSGSSLNVLRVRFNSISTNQYSHMVIRGNGAGANAYSNTNWDAVAHFSPVYNSDGGSNYFSNNEFYIPNYTSTKAKSLMSQGVQDLNQSTSYLVAYLGLSSDTSAITSINLISQTGNFGSNSTFYLYGIKNS